MERLKIIKNAKEILKSKGPMAAVVLANRLKEDYAIDISSNRLAQLINIYGKKDIISRRRTSKETGFGSYVESSNIRIYEAIK